MVKKKILDFIAILVAILIVYFIAGKIGLELAFLHPNASAVWLGTGIAISVLFIFGYRYWPAIFIGAFLVNFTTEGTILTSLGIAIGNSLEGFLGAYLIKKHAGGHAVLDKPKNIFIFLLIAVIVGIISAVIGIFSLTLGGFYSWSEFFHVGIIWFVGNVVSALVIFPLVISWYNPETKVPKRTLEYLIVMALIVLITILTFTQWSPFATMHYPIQHLSILPLLWASLRLGHRGTSLAVLLTSAVSILGTINGFGPFSPFSLNESLVFLQIYRGTISILGLTVSSLVIEERKLVKKSKAVSNQAED